MWIPLMKVNSLKISFGGNMPVKLKKKKGGFEVSTPGGVKAKKTTKKKAKSQERLLNALDHGWTPKKGSRRKKK